VCVCEQVDQSPYVKVELQVVEPVCLSYRSDAVPLHFTVLKMTVKLAESHSDCSSRDYTSMHDSLSPVFSCCYMKCC